jgi:HSP20 family protein
LEDFSLNSKKTRTVFPSFSLPLGYYGACRNACKTENETTTWKYKKIKRRCPITSHSVVALPKRKISEKEAGSQEKKEIGESEERELERTKGARPRTELAPYVPPYLWPDFDKVFNRFRRDFEDILWPFERPFMEPFPRMPGLKAKMPSVDLEDRRKDFLLTAEMPGFKRDEVEIKVQDDSVEIRAETGWKREDKTKKYVVKERGGERFYRMIRLPEEIKTDAVDANLRDGIMEIVLPKKTPKSWKKVSVK